MAEGKDAPPGNAIDQSEQDGFLPALTQASAPTSIGGGIFDGGLETYRTVTEDDYRILLTAGLVVIDTNALLDLYRYHAKTRDELIDVLGRLEGRLWVPHHVMSEFFERRNSVIDSHSKEIDDVIDGLNKNHAALEGVIRAWSNRSGFPQRQTAQLISTIDTAILDVIKRIRELSVDNAFENADDTAQDPVIIALSSILAGRVGEPLPSDALLTARKTARQRIIDKIPPGWKDAGKRSNAEGDYLIWYQTLQESKRRGADVLFITGDIKDDWWRKEHGEVKGPLPELVQEMRTIANVRLFMLRPESLLVHAARVLGVSISEESVQDAERVSSRASVAYNIARAQTQLHQAATELIQVVRSLKSSSDNKTYAALSMPTEDLATALAASGHLDLLDAAWSVIKAGIEVGIFGGTASWQPSLREQETWAALDTAYLAAVQCWLEAAVERHMQEIGGHSRGSFDQGPLPPGIASVEVEFMPEQLQGSERGQFNAAITDGRRVSIRRVYGIQPA